MDGFSFYRIYQPLHLHFTGSYDCFKYKNRSKSINIESYNKRKEIPIFESWSNRYTSNKKVGRLCLSNNVDNELTWLYQSKEEAEKVQSDWESRLNNIDQTIQNETKLLQSIMIDKSLSGIENLISKTPKGNKPPLLQILLLESQIHKEFIVFLDQYTPFLESWNQQYLNDPYISQKLFIIEKYKQFIQPFFNPSFNNIFRELVSE